MKFTEFEKNAKKRVAERHDISTQQLDEILPALAIAGRAVAGHTNVEKRSKTSLTSR
jgi:hypothetical protein